MKTRDLVALHVKKEALPAEIHPVNLSAMMCIRDRGQIEQSWMDYYVTIVGFPSGDPMTVSIGKVVGETTEKGNINLESFTICDL